jgi:RNA polymerase sigma factor (TIGR02999 family)
MSDVTRLLDAAAAGHRRAAADLLPLVYDELRKLAAARMAGESPDHTLQPTALVHEAYLRLVGRGDDLRWDGRGHFFAAAAEAMRRILVEAARRKGGPDRGGDFTRHDLDPDQPSPSGPSPGLLALDEALDRLGAIEPRAAEVVKLRYFAGLTVAEAAAALGISPRTADNDWAYARAWLVTALRDEG